MNLCINCAHCKNAHAATPWCVEPRAKVDPVRGENTGESCDKMRGDPQRCGLEGRWFSTRSPADPGPPV